MPPYAVPPFCIYILVCTTHYFYAFMYRPTLFDAMNNGHYAARAPVKTILFSIYEFGVIVGVSGMIYLGLKEIFTFVAPAYLPSDNALGLFGVLLASIWMSRLKKIVGLIVV